MKVLLFSGVFLFSLGASAHAAVSDVPEASVSTYVGLLAGAGTVAAAFRRSR